MSDSAPSSENLVEELQSSDRFSELVEEIAEHFHEDEYKDDRIPEIKTSFREDAEDAGLSEGEAKGVAGRLIGTLMQRAGEQAPPPPESKWDALEADSGPLPEDRYEELPGPLFRLLRLVETEEEPFRQVHRLIDAVEWAVKWHTTLALSDLLAAGDLPDQVKVLLAQSLRTPSLGTWNRFFREATSAFDEIEAEPSLPWERFERLTNLENEHHLVSFRNQYGHGATPPPEECLENVKEYFPVLKELVHTPLFTKVGLAVRGEETSSLRLTGAEREPVDLDLSKGHAAVLLPEESDRETIDLWPLGITAEAEVDGDEADSDEEPRFFFFNALKNRSVDQLNYEGPVHRRDEGLYDSFTDRLPLRAWREEATAELESFAREVAALTESFKGRREERARLRGFAASGEGTLMVYGAPGIGKSALLAQVTREIEAGVDADGQDLTDENGEPIDPPPVIEYFIRRSEGKDDPTRLLRYLCRHLDDRYGLDGQGLGSEPVELQEQLSARLQAIEENAEEDENQSQPERTVLLVDGLDEAPELGKYIPEARPWLPVIVASRETPEATDFYEGRRRETRSTMTVGPLGKREVRAILYGGVNKYDPAFDDEYVEAVADRSEGNPLYLTLLAEELFQGKIEVGDIDALPEKIGELYGEALRRVTDGGENQTALDLLHLLAEAKAPLTEEAIGELLEINPMQASSAARDAMELLHEASPEALYPTSEDPPSEAVQLFHESLREWLREKHRSTCKDMRERLAKKTAEWGERRSETARRYALRYGALHQREAGKYEELYDLLTGENYQEEQVRAFKQYEATYSSFEAGLEAYVERYGETPEDDARLCRLALDAGQAAREAKEGVTQAFRWAEDGRMEDALQRTQVLDEEKYFLAALRLIWIEADRQAEKPEEERSAEKAQKVLDAVEEQIPPGTEAIDWSEFVHAGFMAHWIENVLLELPSLDIRNILKRTSTSTYHAAFESQPDTIFEQLVAYFDPENVAASDAIVQSLLRIIRSLDGYKARGIFVELVETLTSSGKLERAVEVLNTDSIEERHLSEALPSVVDAVKDLEDAGFSSHLDQILEIIQSLNRRKARAISVVVESVFTDRENEQTGRIVKKLLDTIRTIDSDRRRVETFAKVVKGLMSTGQFEIAEGVMREALDTTRSIGDEKDRARALTTLLEIIVSEGIRQVEVEIEHFLETARSINDHRSRAKSLAGVSRCLAAMGRNEETEMIAEEALDSARSVADEENRIIALTDVCEALAITEKIEQALQVSEEVIDSIQLIENDWTRASTIGRTARILASIGEFKKEDPLREKIISVANSENALDSVATELADEGDINLALDIADLIESDSSRADALSDVTQALLNSGDLQEAFEVGQSISRGRTRANVLSDVAQAFIETGALGEAFEVIQCIDRDRERAELCVILFKSLISANRGGQPSISIAKLLDETLSLDRLHLESALIGIAEALSHSSEFDRTIPTSNQVLEVVRDAYDPDDSERADVCLEVTFALTKTGKHQKAVTLAGEVLDNAHSITLNSDRKKALTGVYGSFLATGKTQKAGKSFEEIFEGVGDSASERPDNLIDTVEVLTDIEQFENAISIATSIDSDRWRADTLTSISESLTETNLEGEKTKAHVENVIASARSLEEFQSVATLAEVAEFLALSGENKWATGIAEEALDTGQSLDDDERSSLALVGVAKAFAAAGEVERSKKISEHVLDAARRMDNGYTQYSILIGVAKSLAESGFPSDSASLIDHLLETARSIEGFWQADSLSEVSQVFADVGEPDQTSSRFEKIINFALSVGSDSTRADILSAVAEALTQINNFKKKELLIEKIASRTQSLDPQKGSQSIFGSVAQGLAQIGKFQKALSISHSIEDNRKRVEAFTNVAEVLAEIQELEQFEIAIDEALEVVSSSDLPDAGIAKLLLDVAETLAKHGKFERALSLMEEALTEALSSHKIPPLVIEDASKILMSISSRQIDSTVKQLLETAQSIEDNGSRERALSYVAEILTQTGDLQSALDLSLSITDLSVRIRAVKNVANREVEENSAVDFASHLPVVELDHDGWTNFLSTWREALLEHEEDPRPLLRRSFTLYPFDAEAAAEGVYSLVQAHIQKDSMNHAKAIASECPELELDVLVTEPELPIPEGCDPDDLPVRQRAEYDTYVDLYEEGTLDDDAFESKVRELFKEADLD